MATATPINRATRKAACLAAAVVLVANVFIAGAQPIAVGLVPSPWDKLAHIALFGVLAVLLMVSVEGRRAWLVVAALVVVAVADELFQTQLPGREASLADLAADFAGTATGVLTFCLLPGVRRTVLGNDPSARD